MTPSAATSPTWLLPIRDMITAAAGRGGFFVALHEYRPELVQEMATGLDLDFFDFRATCMRPLGWDAGRLPLDTMSAEIDRRCRHRGLVLHNAEALLATKAASERQQWLASFVAADWPHAVIVPIAIFQPDLPPRIAARFHRVDPDHVPAETLLSRLATQ